VNLAKMKLNPALLNQIIAAGPVEGLALAKSLSGAGQPTIDELNSLYNQAGSIATNTAKDFAKTQTNYYIEVSGGLGDKATIGKAIVEAVKAYERQNGKVFS
jgi:transaldolase